MTRFILTGTPGAGKTSVLERLQAMGFDVVGEAATAIIAEEQARGVAEPWASGASFIDKIVERQSSRVGKLGGRDGVRIHDRSVVCTLALCKYLGYEVPGSLTAELDRVKREKTFERQVFFIRNLGFCEPTAARRISFEDSLQFEQVHENCYRELGYELIEVEPASVGERAAVVARMIDLMAGEQG